MADPGRRRTFAVPVQDVQGGDEELVRVLLLVPRQVPRVSPHQVQQLVGDVGGAVPRVELLTDRERRRKTVRNKYYALNTKHTR